MSRAATPATPATPGFRLKRTLDRPAEGPLLFAPYPNMFFVETEDGVSGPHTVSTKNFPAGYYQYHEGGTFTLSLDCGTLTHPNGTVTHLPAPALATFRVIIDPTAKALPQWVEDFEAAAKRAYSTNTPDVCAFRRSDGQYVFSARSRECVITEKTTWEQAIRALLYLDAKNGWFNDARAHLDALERCSINARR